MTDLVMMPLPNFKQAQQFFPEQTPWPEGVYEFIDGAKSRGLSSSNIKYLLDTPDGTVEVYSGDWIVKTFDNSHWYVRVG